MLGLVAAVAAAGIVVRAVADEWRAPSLFPQRWGWRGARGRVERPGAALRA